MAVKLQGREMSSLHKWERMTIKGQVRSWMKTRWTTEVQDEPCKENSEPVHGYKLADVIKGQFQLLVNAVNDCHWVPNVTISQKINMNVLGGQWQAINCHGSVTLRTLPCGTPFFWAVTKE